MVNLAFYRFGETLVHWTHSFLCFHNTSEIVILQDGMMHKNLRKKLEKLRMDNVFGMWYDKYVGVSTAPPLSRL